MRSKMEGLCPDKFRHDAQNADNARKNTAFPAAWYLPLYLALPDTCLLTLRDDPRPEIAALRTVFIDVYANRAKLLGEA